MPRLTCLLQLGKSPDLGVLAVLFCGAIPGAAQMLETNPRRVMADEPARIRVLGLRPGEAITIRARLTDGAGRGWQSEAEFVAESDGAVDPSRQRPARGSYSDVSSLGLIWSMMPVEKDVTGYRFPEDLADQLVTLSLVREGTVVSEDRLEVVRLAEGVQRIPVREPSGLRGVLFLPSSPGPHPGVLVLGGSGGGLPDWYAPWLAARGFAAFALAYFNHDDLPPRLAAIPLEYFERGLAWMAKRPEVKPGGVGAFGASRGGELVLQLGSMFPLIRCVVALVPGSIRYKAQAGLEKVDYAWTWKGRPLPYVPDRDHASPEAMRAAAIEVERTRGPILLISGDGDRLWPSAEMADAVMARLRSRQFRYRFEHLKYPGAGHGAGTPLLYPRWVGAFRHRITGNLISFGGSPRADALSSVDSMPRVLSFLRAGLR